MIFLKNVTDCHNFFLLGKELEGYSGVREGLPGCIMPVRAHLFGPQI